jgi:Flp pilus assembly pilin Flp
MVRNEEGQTCTDRIRNEEGQAVTEYVLMLAAIVSLYLLMTAGLVRIGLAKRLMTPLTTQFAAVYRYGHPKAKGFDDGGPEYHPRAMSSSGQNNFRLFIYKKDN